MPAYDAKLFNPAAPLAQITLRNLKNDATQIDVPMLLGSGADVTLVQRSCINRLGVIVDPDLTYELLAFDGRISVAQVVELDLIFLERTFRGRFLITDQEVGILGRDVLNHISLLLDGPQLFWSEERSTRS
jgi:hypothetical protein